MEIKSSTPSGVSSEAKLWSALNYVFPILMLIVVYLMEDKKKDKFIMFHAWQSTILAIVAWVVSMIVAVVTFGIGSLCMPLIILVFLYFAYKAYQGEKFLLPVVGEFAEKQVK
ncbi:MAG: hypothetical protein AB1295_00735 [Candidatus Micrarchaeota archaeon]